MALPLHADVAAFYVFAVWMLDSREQALVEVAAGVRAAPQAGLTMWVADLIRTLALAEPRGRGRDDRFAALGELLRLDHSIAVDLDHPAIAGDVRRLHVLLWEVKRARLASGARALWPVCRGLFVLVPVVAMVSGAIVHGEPLGLLQIVAMACFASALALALLLPARREPPPTDT